MRHYHTGIVVAHNIGGARRYKENNWVARAGDTLYEVAGSSHTPESFEDTEIFFYMVGELLFLDPTTKSSGRKIRRHLLTATPATAPTTASLPVT